MNRTQVRTPGVIPGLALALALVTLPATGAHTRAADHPAAVIPILDQPVVVTATLQDTTGDDLHDVRLRIHHGADCYETGTYLFRVRDVSEAAAHLRKVIGWKDGYLFVRTECGGGNAWKCDQDVVFSFRGGRLRPLGALASFAPVDSGIGNGLRDSVFHDFDADWENNEVTAHANAPGVWIAMRDAGGRLKVDLARTWRLTLPEYRQNDSTWRALRESAPSPEVDFARTGALFGNAVIARYCDRPRELTETLSEARRVLRAKDLQALERTLAGIRPGTFPRTSRARLEPCAGGH